MLKRLGAFACVLLLGACGTTAHVGQYAEIGSDDEYTGDGFPTVVYIEKQIDERRSIHCFHLSHIALGWPWGFGRETEVNACGVKFKLW